MRTGIWALVAAAVLMSSAARGAAEKELILYLPLDEGRGRTAADGAGGIRQGVLMGSAEWVGGKFGKALRLDGEPGSYVDIALPETWYNDNLDGLTVFLWVKPSGKQGEIFFGSHQPADSRLYLAVGQGGRWAMGIQDKPWGKGGKGVRLKADTDWHAVAMTLDGSKATLYVDGAPVVEKPYTKYALGARPALGGVAGASGQFGFAGAVDEFALYRGVLTPAEIKEAMAGVAHSTLCKRRREQHKAFLAQRDAFRPSLVAHWAFDDGEGDQATDGGKHGLHAKIHDADWDAGLRGLALRCWARLLPARAEVPAHPALGGWPAMTVEAWVKWDPRGPNMPALVSKGYAEQLALYMHRYSRNVYVALATDKARLEVRTTAKLPVYQWAHLALTWDSATSQAAVYVNGKRQWTGKLAGSAIRTSSAPLLIAANAGKGKQALGSFAGRIDDLKIYSAALPAELIAASHARLAELAEAGSGTRWVSTRPGLKPLAETCLDPETKALTYPAFPMAPMPKPQKTLSAADFASIQAAVDALPKGGGMVMVPAGVWDITKPIVLRPHVALVGAGASTVIVNKNQEGANAIEATENEQYRPRELHPPGARGHHGVYIARLQVRGNPKSGHGIALSQSDHFTVETCWLFLNGKSGLWLSYGEENDIVRGVVAKWNGEHGLYIEGCHDTLISASHFEENRLDGIHVQKDNIQAGIIGCNVEDNGRFGIYNKGRWTQVIGCQSDGNQGRAFIFIGPEMEYQTTVSGCCGDAVRAVEAYNVTVTGSNLSVHLSGCHGCTIVGNRAGAITLESGSRLCTVGSNVATRITLSDDCRDIAVTGNVCRSTVRGDPERNAIANNVAPIAEEGR